MGRLFLKSPDILCISRHTAVARQYFETNMVEPSAAPISGPFDAVIDDGITFDASIKKAEIRDAEKGWSSSIFPIESNERGSDFP